MRMPNRMSVNRVCGPVRDLCATDAMTLPLRCGFPECITIYPRLPRGSFPKTVSPAPRHSPAATARPHGRGPGAMPELPVVPMRLRVTAVEEGVVVFQVKVMDLDPDPRHVDGVHVGREPPVRLVDVGADIFDAVDDLRPVAGNLLDISPATVALEDAVEIGAFAVDPLRAVLQGHHRIHRLGHVPVVWRAHALDQ